jgi:hypothetical protein
VEVVISKMLLEEVVKQVIEILEADNKEVISNKHLKLYQVVSLIITRHQLVDNKKWDN